VVLVFQKYIFFVKEAKLFLKKYLLMAEQNTVLKVSFISSGWLLLKKILLKTKIRSVFSKWWFCFFQFG